MPALARELASFTAPSRPHDSPCPSAEYMPCAASPVLNKTLYAAGCHTPTLPSPCMLRLMAHRG